MNESEEKQVDYELELARGKAYEQAISTFFKEELDFEIGVYETKEEQYTIGESQTGIEIKYDSKSFETGNLYIEVAEKSRSWRKDYQPSGIFREDNSRFYLIGNHQDFFLFKKEFLQNLYHEFGYCELPIRSKTKETSKGFLIDIEQLMDFLYTEKGEDICLLFKPAMVLAYGLPNYTDQNKDLMKIPEKENFLAFIK